MFFVCWPVICRAEQVEKVIWRRSGTRKRIPQCVCVCVCVEQIAKEILRPDDERRGEGERARTHKH